MQWIADPQETKNLADLPEHTGTVEERLQRLARAQRVYGDK